MSLFGKKMVDIAHELFEEYICEGDCCIDATMGTGCDTLKLCQCVGNGGRVYAFDIQPEALAQTKALLSAFNIEERAQLIQDSHDKIEAYVHENIQAFVFNLGYLPGGNPNVITKKDTTEKALLACLKLLKAGGIGIVAAYYGHEGGVEEKNHVDKLLHMLPVKKFDVIKLESHNRHNFPPILYMIKRKK